MAEKKDRGRKALDVGSTLVTAAGTLVDMGATGGALAGGKLLWDAVTAGISHRRRKQAQAYLKRLAEALGEENTAALAVDLDQAGENAVWETVEEGFRAMMGAINETAKRCIALLVADYVVRRELPDREFQLMGGLLASTDESLLACIYMITQEFCEVYQSHEEGVGSFQSYEIIHSKDRNKNPEVYARCTTTIHGDPQGRVESDGRIYDEVYSTMNRVVLQLLFRHEFGVIPEGAQRSPRSTNEKHPNGGAVELWLHGSAATRLRRLHNYLVPVFCKSSTSERRDQT